MEKETQIQLLRNSLEKTTTVLRLVPNRDTEVGKVSDIVREAESVLRKTDPEVQQIANPSIL